MSADTATSTGRVVLAVCAEQARPSVPNKLGRLCRTSSL